jgi:lambda repressor-like predicted transcriptional regulator
MRLVVNDLPVINTQFGEEVRKRLEQHGWSFRGATIATGIDYGTIGNMASGMVPRKGVIVDWAIALKEDVNWWLELAGYPPIPPEVLHPKPGDIIVVLKDESTQLTEEQRSEIIEFAEKLKREVTQK